ncbi:MAG: hypothetical protein KGI00_01365 [Candidatus Micrarchaeota archaeon]|nr:hypothetical protein [Candidatus Micrarchaeota archaeon]MDE1824075.1 hypothetical protein [Candidatus Micrarchaeota archaeon]MDE1849358.1 hypothetical protein [Candidatus Micrarchaeota archaeon]
MAHLAERYKSRALEEHELRQILKSVHRPGETSIEKLRREYERVVVDGVPIIRRVRQRTMDDFWMMKGWYRREGENVELTPAQWKFKPKSRSSAVRFLFMEVLKMDPKDASQEQFISNRLEGLLNEYFSGSPYKAVSEAFPELAIKPWEMSVTSAHFFDSKENRIRATRWLIEEKLGIKPRNASWNDFVNNRLRSLMTYHNNSPYAAISEAYPERDIRPWEMKHTPNHTYESRETRIEAIRWLTEKTARDPRKLKRAHFKKHRLEGMLYHYYSSSPYKAVCEAFPELGIKSWEMNRVQPGFFRNVENVIEAVWWIVERIGKEPTAITREEMHMHMKGSGLGGLLDMYGRSHYRLLSTAGLITESDEFSMRTRAAEIALAKSIARKEELAALKAA